MKTKGPFKAHLHAIPFFQLGVYPARFLRHRVGDRLDILRRATDQPKE